MPTFLDNSDDRVIEESTALFSMTLTDEEEVVIQAADITSLNWTLTDTAGAIINNRSAVDIPSPTNPQKILLQGYDLVISGSDNVQRVLTVEGTYNSTNGSNLSIKDQCRFWIDNLVAVSSESSESSSSES